MRLSTSLVAVKKITSSVPRTDFSEEEINKVGQSIVAAEGIINPLILRRTGLESYEVVEGHFEFYAATKAREINPLKGEMVTAFILDDENQAGIEAQIQLLRNQAEKSVPVPPVVPDPPAIAPIVAEVKPREIEDPKQKATSEDVTKLMEQFDQLLQKQLQSVREAIAISIQNLEAKLTEKIEAIEQISAKPVSIVSSGTKSGYTHFKVDELKRELKKRNISFSPKAKKADLMALLKEDDARQSQQ